MVENKQIRQKNCRKKIIDWIDQSVMWCIKLNRNVFVIAVEQTVKASTTELQLFLTVEHKHT